MPDSIFCYHCATHHPAVEMRQIETKGGMRWRCIRSIKAAKKDRDAREAFGRQTTAINKDNMEAVKRRMAKPEQEK